MSCPRHLQRLTGTVASKTANISADVTSNLTQVTRKVTASKPFKEIPGPRGIYQWPIVGPALLFKPFTNFTAGTADKLFEHLFEKFGPIVRLQLTAPTILIHRPRDMEQLFANEGRYPAKPSFSLTKTFNRRNGIRDSLADADGTDWQRLRSPLNRHLSQVNSAAHYLESQGQVADEFAKILVSIPLGAEELRDWFFRYATECIGLVCLNTRLGLMDAKVPVNPDALRFVDETKNIFVQIQNVMSGKSILHNYYRNKTCREYDKSNTFVRRYVRQKLARAQEALNAPNNRQVLPDLRDKNLLATLLAEKELDTEDVENMMLTLYVAGMESTAKNLQAFFYSLASNPDKQEKLYNEIVAVLGVDGQVTSDKLRKMPYLKACLKESFRLRYPSMTGPLRILPHDVVIGGYSVPAGVQVLSCNQHTCKTVYSEADKFLPERWLRSEDDRKLPQDVSAFAFLPFGYGPRNCIGKRFAEQELYLATIKTLQRAKIELCEESRNTEFIYAIFIAPSEAIKFRFVSRETRAS